MLAQLRAGLVQQCRMIRAVNVVAKRAVFGGWLVFPQEWAAFLCVAFVAGFVDGVVDQAGFTR